MSSSNNKPLLIRGFVALILLVVFLAVALLMPRIMSTNTLKTHRLVFGYLHIEYKWIGNTTIVFNFTNKYSVPITIKGIRICDDIINLNNTIIKVNESATVVVEDVVIKRTCCARVYYEVAGYERERLMVIKPLNPRTS